MYTNRNRIDEFTLCRQKYPDNDVYRWNASLLDASSLFSLIRSTTTVAASIVVVVITVYSRRNRSSSASATGAMTSAATTARTSGEYSGGIAIATWSARVGELNNFRNKDND